MVSSLGCPPCEPAEVNGSTKEVEERGMLSQVDSFLVEALENPRHRLTVTEKMQMRMCNSFCSLSYYSDSLEIYLPVLRMELDIQRFMQSSDQCQFEFQHFPTSYLRCAAHRVAQHYGLQTLVVENIADGSGSRIVVRKTPESRYPAICLSDIPIKQPENEQKGQVKIVIRPRPNKASQIDMEGKRNRIIFRTVEKRKEDYDKARARIFNGSFSADNDLVAAADGRNSSSSGDEKETCRNVTEELERIGIKEAASRVAIFRDREKDRSDPDYDRSYDRYARGFVPCNSLALGACNVLQPSHVQYDGAYSQMGYRPVDPSTINVFGSVGCSQTSPSAVYVQWPSPAMMYAQSYEHFRHAVFQLSVESSNVHKQVYDTSFGENEASQDGPVYQQPLSFDHMQNS
ncbi:hypothetical protein IEQ34_005773 [Dendrobium chrysotoxum]|uniref:Uncharacterized protein n=1 Tax=Dendrobium chrysotoxum TaxID=161865 RepID=A0AAV7HC14_DENCH|nr:hypothetical protein IEQ34_005773 [Dendrobium chrysotoxum]